MTIKSHPYTVEYFKEMPFYKKPIEKPKIKRLKNIDLLSELRFYEELSIIKTNHAFEGYAMSFKVEIIERKDPISQLEANKSSVSNLMLNNLLNETKGFKYQMTLKVKFKNYRPVRKIELMSQFISTQQQKQ